MSNPVVDIVKGLFAPAKELISELIVDRDKANELSAALYAAEAAVVTKVIDYESQLVVAKQNIIVAEAQGESWLQRNWRPIMMLTFGGLVCAKWLGFTAEGITEPVELALMDLIQIGVGGYVVGRSAEKIIPQVAEIIRNK